MANSRDSYGRFAKGHHLYLKHIANGVEYWKKERENIFNLYGWQVIFFDETQVNDVTIANLLGGG